MKVVITGPRAHSAPPDYELPYLHLETEMEHLPRVGDKIIINDGNSVVVENIMWWVDGPDTPESYRLDGMYEGEGQLKTIHLQVLPPDWSRLDPYPEGVKAGRAAMADELVSALEILAPMTDAGELRAALKTWALRAGE